MKLCGAITCCEKSLEVLGCLHPFLYRLAGSRWLCMSSTVFSVNSSSISSTPEVTVSSRNGVLLWISWPTVGRLIVFSASQHQAHQHQLAGFGRYRYNLAAVAQRANSIPTVNLCLTFFHTCGSDVSSIQGCICIHCRFPQCSGYHVRLTRERSSVRNRAETNLSCAFQS